MRLVLTGVVCAALSSSACGDPPAIGDVVALEIQRVEWPGPKVGEARRVTVDGDASAAALVHAIGRCRGPEVVKFAGRYRMRAIRRDGTEQGVIVNGHRVKVNGVAFACRDDMEALAARTAAGP